MKHQERARLWFEQGQQDLLMARRNVEIGGYYVSAFLAQQAVEKFLKAAHALETGKIPRTHYLDELARALDLPTELYRAILSLMPD